MYDPHIVSSQRRYLNMQNGETQRQHPRQPMTIAPTSSGPVPFPHTHQPSRSRTIAVFPTQRNADLFVGATESFAGLPAPDPTNLVQIHRGPEAELSMGSRRYSVMPHDETSLYSQKQAIQLGGSALRGEWVNRMASNSSGDQMGSTKASDDEEEDEEDEDEDQGGLEDSRDDQSKGKARAAGERPGEVRPGSRPLEGTSKKVGGARVKGACEGCKIAKVRCELSPRGSSSSTGKSITCRRCFGAGIRCVVPGRKIKKPPPPHNELERRVKEQNKEIVSLLAQLALSSSPHAPTTSYHPQNPYPNMYPNPPVLPYQGTVRVIDPDMLDQVAPLGHWEKKLPKEEREVKVDKWIQDILQTLYPQHTACSGFHEEQHRDVSPATGDTKPRWQIEVDLAESEDHISENGDKVAASDPEFTSPGLHRMPGGTTHIPKILKDDLVNMDTCKELFAIYYDKINIIGFSVCDPFFHTLERVFNTSSFLFTTICAVASRHYTDPNLYPRLLAAAKRAAASAVNGPKTVETCQAYMILGTFTPPSRKFSEDRNYLFIGMALRIASDLQLHRAKYTYPPEPSMPETKARALLNRARVWLNCFCTDRSIAVQIGKPIVFTNSATGGQEPIQFDIKEWWKCSQYNLPQDFYLCAYACLLRVMSGFHDLVFSADAYESHGQKKALKLETIQNYADKITDIQREWLRLKEQYIPRQTDRKLIWRDALWPFIVSYTKLVVVSVGLREGMRKGLKQDNPFSEQCINAASSVLRQVVNTLAELGYLRYCPEAWFVFMGFAAGFLLKILRPKFAFMMNPDLEKELVNLIQRLIDLLGSDRVAINDRHTPKLYARFLDGLLKEYKEGKFGVKSSRPTAKVEPQLHLAVQANSVTDTPYQTPQPFADNGGTSLGQARMTTWSPPDPSTPPYETPPTFQLSQPYPSLQSEIPMDIDDPNSIYWQIPIPPDFANLGYVYPPITAPQDTGLEHPSMQAFSEVFWSEYGAMPGYNSVAPYQSSLQHGAEEGYASGVVEMPNMYSLQ